MLWRLRDAARIDLAEIWLGSAERWGMDQADAYIRAIESRLQHACDFPESYPLYEGSRGPFRKATSGSHVMFYRVDGDVIDVVRILHSRMDPSDAL